ncbi:Envelope-like protein [Abeliophyllum distichum]|uniref:Envelope-like protein n=1 Tax=Abeliophyllum distichum TaxID=126358 RepID=A0ABD1V765_9LAMI
MVNLIHSCGWQRVAGKPHLAYPLLVKEFLANFNHAVKEPEVNHRYTTWVRGKLIKFSPDVISNYYGLTTNDIEHFPADFDMTQVTQFLYGREDAWPLAGPKFLHNQLTESLRIFHIFVCYNIDLTSHRTDFKESRAQFLYHLACGYRIDLGDHIFRFIVDLASHSTETDRLLRQIFTHLSEQGRVLNSIQSTQLAMQRTVDHMRIEMDSLKESNNMLRGEQQTINYMYDDVNHRMIQFARRIDDIYTIISQPFAPSDPHHGSTPDDPSDHPRPSSPNLPPGST